MVLRSAIVTEGEVTSKVRQLGVAVSGGMGRLGQGAQPLRGTGNCVAQTVVTEKDHPSFKLRFSDAIDRSFWKSI